MPRGAGVAFRVANVFSIGLIMAVRREVEQRRACGLDGGAHARALVAAIVVHHHDVAGLEFRDKIETAPHGTNRKPARANSDQVVS